MYQMDLSDYLRAYLKYILPHAVASTITDTDNSLLGQLAEYFETSPREMCDKNAHYLLEYYLMSEDDGFTKRGYGQLQVVFESNNIILELLASHRTKITSSLAMRLADPDGERVKKEPYLYVSLHHKKKKKRENGLIYTFNELGPSCSCSSD